MFSVGVQWTELEWYLSHKFNREIIRVPGDGACFIRSVKHCLSRDLDVNYTIDEICDKIFEEVCDNAEEYSKFHTNSKWQLISDMLKYLNDWIYTIDIVDVAVQACANALKVNLYIYERTGPKVILIPTYSKIASNRNIFLLYNRLGGSVHGGDHYSVIVEPEASPQEITNIVSNVQQNENATNSKQMMKGNQKGMNQGGGLLICMQMFQVYITDLVMNSTVVMETTCMMNLVICVGLPRVIHLMIPVEMVFNWVQRAQRPRKVMI